MISSDGSKRNGWIMDGEARWKINKSNEMALGEENGLFGYRRLFPLD